MPVSVVSAGASATLTADDDTMLSLASGAACCFDDCFRVCLCDAVEALDLCDEADAGLLSADVT